jgi:hypothetical protein
LFKRLAWYWLLGDWPIIRKKLPALIMVVYGGGKGFLWRLNNDAA